MGEIDQGIKVLLQGYAPDIIAFAAPGAHDITPIPPEVYTPPQLIPDGVFQGIYGRTSCLFHLEAQLFNDTEMPRRCFEYGARLSTVYSLPVISIVLWLETQTYPASPYVMQAGERDLATWHFINVPLRGIQAQAVLEEGHLGLLPLLPFTRGADLTTVEQAVVTIKNHAPPDQLEDLVGVLGLFASRHFGDTPVRALYRRLFMNVDILKHMPLYHSLMAEARAEAAEEAKAEGMAEGIAEGKAEGMAQGYRQSIQIVLEGRFGALDAALVQAIAGADEVILIAALPHIGTDTIEEIRARFS